MKKDTHPTYQEVLFVDSASGHRFICGSTLQTESKENFQGKEYPVCYLSISSSSHPFFTGSKQLVDSEGRVEKFKKRFGRKEAPKEENGSEGNQEKEQEQSKAKAIPAKKAGKAPAKK